MRADRLLSILLLLQMQRSITARELAQRLEVSERTIQRDMEALGAAGIPVYAERGSGGGWRLEARYQTNLNGLNQSEIQALFLVHSSHILAELGLHQAAEGALIKLLAALPSLARRNAELVRQHIHVDGAGWHQAREAVPFLPLLQEAIWQQRKLDLRYLRNDQTTVERRVDPLGLVVKGTAWYLVAAVEHKLRTYRVARVQAATITDQHCERPDGFDLAQYWEQNTAQFVANLPRYPARLYVDQAIIPAMRIGGHWSRVLHVGAPDAHGWVDVEVLSDNFQSACEYVLSFGAQIYVREPAELRAHVLSTAQSTLALYSQALDCHLTLGHNTDI